MCEQLGGCKKGAEGEKQGGFSLLGQALGEMKPICAKLLACDLEPGKQQRGQAGRARTYSEFPSPGFSAGQNLNH